MNLWISKSLSFQFSLWDSAEHPAHARHTGDNLSILFMRFRIGLLSLEPQALQPSFNSLYEIPDSVREPGGHTDSHTFNSLYEILRCPRFIYMKRGDRSFNSLYEIQDLWRRPADARWCTPFQFSLWDSEKTGDGYRVWSESFNSLYEILHVAVCDAEAVAYFQFSLWDSPKPDVNVGSFSPFQFSLWDSCAGERSLRLGGLWSFNSLYEILWHRFPRTYWNKRKSFQFSLWDSGFPQMSMIILIRWMLSILFMRFSRRWSWIYASTLKTLSILFMRFPCSMNLWISKSLSFQFSLWDSSRASWIALWGSSFQFSLWDSPCSWNDPSPL